MKIVPLLLCMACAAKASAQQIKTDSAKQILLDEVSVTGSVIKAAAVSKNGIREMDIPQAVAVLHQKLLQQQQVASLSDILKNVNGIYIMGTTGGYQEEIASRGSSISNSNTFKNGIRFYSGMKIELSGLEKVEILKGNTAIEYGNVAPGGIINLVTKKPKFNFGGSAAFTIASFNGYKTQLDIYGALNKKKSMAYRLNGSYESAKSFRKNIESDALYFNPSVLIKLSPKAILLVEGDYNKSNTTPDFGAGIINYQIVSLPRNRFTGVTWGRYKAQQSYVSAKYTQALSATNSISVLSAFRNYNTCLFANARPNSAGSIVQENGSWKRNIQKQTARENYFITQADFNSIQQTGKIQHQILIGFDAEQFTTNSIIYNAKTGYDVINIFDSYKAEAEPAIPVLTENTFTKNPVKRMGIYGQDLISFSKFLKVLVGARYNNIKSTSDVYSYAGNTNTVTTIISQPFSPKLGLVLQPTNKCTLFGSYSNSFTLNTGVDIAGNALKPSIIDQFETGIKNKLAKGKLQLNITAYQINNNNLAQTSLANGNNNANVKELAGKTKGRGLELDAFYTASSSLNLVFGYSFNQTKYTASNIYIEGSELRYNPKNTANASAGYHVEKGAFKNMNLGFIAQYFGTRYAGRSTRLTVNNDAYRLIQLSDYFLLDFTLGYQWKKWKLNGKYANILNELNYNIHDDNSLNPLAPSNFSLQLSRNF